MAQGHEVRDFSGHRRLRAGVIFVALTLLLACAPRETARYGATVPGAQTQTVYVATQRALNRTGAVFGEKRPERMNFFRNEISIPPTHEPGLVEWTPRHRPVDPNTDFVVTDTRIFDGMASMIRDLRSHETHGESLVFIHGYNNTLSEAMYRLAQIRADFQMPMPSILFSWPSAGDPRGYIYDRDSVLYARDDMEAMLHALTAKPGEKVFLLAHSMGAQLTMEVLRQAALRGDHQLLSRISGVVLMSPDIDPDLFQKQAEAIGKLPQPFMIFISRQDRALSLAGFLSGRKTRLGRIDGPDKVGNLEVSVIDFTALGDGEGLNHFTPVTSPAAVQVLRGMITQAETPSNAFERYMVLSAQP